MYLQGKVGQTQIAPPVLLTSTARQPVEDSGGHHRRSGVRDSGVETVDLQASTRDDT